MPPTVWLVNDQGKGMRPVLPQTEYGAYKRAAITAVEQLLVTTRTVQQVPFTRKPPRLAANPAIITVPEAEPPRDEIGAERMPGCRRRTSRDGIPHIHGL